MKHFLKFIFIVFLISLTINPNQLSAQRSHSGVHHTHVKPKVVQKQRPNGRAQVVKSRYKPPHVVIFHPVWGPKRNFNRRWIYFPKYNFYWDNWRLGYYCINSGVWFYSTSPPPIILNININEEKHYELKENEDDIDDVYISNLNHQAEYKNN